MTRAVALVERLVEKELAKEEWLRLLVELLREEGAYGLRDTLRAEALRLLAVLCGPGFNPLFENSGIRAATSGGFSNSRRGSRPCTCSDGCPTKCLDEAGIETSSP